MKKVWLIQLAVLLGLAGLISGGMVYAKANTNSPTLDSSLLYSQATVVSEPVFESEAIDTEVFSQVEFEDPAMADQAITQATETTPIEAVEDEELATTEELDDEEAVTATPKATSKPSPKAVKEEVESSPKPKSSPTTKPAESPKTDTSPTPTTPPIAAPAGGLSAERIFELVNQYRASKGLSALVKDEKVCSLAQSRAPEIYAEIYGGVMHSGLKKRNLDYWNSENIISMRTEEEAVNWWINDYIHRVQMEGDYKYSCVACHGNSCAQEFTNYESK